MLGQKQLKRISMEPQSTHQNKGKPKFNSFMVAKSQFINQAIDLKVLQFPIQNKALPINSNQNFFSSIKSQMTLNSSCFIFTKEQAQAMFKQLSGGNDMITPEDLKAYLFEIGQKQEQAVEMVSLLDPRCTGGVTYKQFQKFLLNRMIPSKENYNRLPSQLLEQQKICQIIDNNYEILEILEDPEILHQLMSQVLQKK